MKLRSWLTLIVAVLSSLVTMGEAYLDKWFFAFWWLGLTIMWTINFVKSRELDYWEDRLEYLDRKLRGRKIGL